MCKDIKSKVENYWTKRADSFMNLREAEIRSNKYQRWEREITGVIDEYKNANNLDNIKILDVGCGCGFFGVILAKCGYKVTGIDITPAMIEKGYKIAEVFNVDMKLMVMDAEKTEFDDESFDIVISRNLTWTLPNAKKAYCEWKRVLKKGGLILNYDAEYAKNCHRNLNLPENHAHNKISEDLKNDCYAIYDMLELSTLNRPIWDKAVLNEIGMKNIEVTEDIGKGIYIEKDEFYIPDSIFRICAYK